MSFRTNLQYLRAQRNMTQERLAMLLGVSRQAISKWESEKAYPEIGQAAHDLRSVWLHARRPRARRREREHQPAGLARRIGNRLRHDCRRQDR